MVEVPHLHNLSKYGENPAHIQTGFIINQKLYDNVFWEEAMGIVAQAYPDIDEENDNEALGLKCFGFLGIEENGQDKLYKLNKDLDTYNVTFKDFNTVDIDFKKMLKQNPDKRILQLSITAGHGMCKDGHQWILVNEI